MKGIDEVLLDRLSGEAENSPRKRRNHNLHESYEDSVQRFLNALHPGTYVRPHRHPRSEDVEAVILLRGRALVVEFDDEGRIVDHVFLDRDRGAFAVEVSPANWHTVMALEEKTVLFEVRNGPYVEENAKVFAQWAPEEGDPGTKAYMETILKRLSIESDFDSKTMAP